MVEKAELGLGLMEQLVLWAGFLGAWLLVAERERLVGAFEQGDGSPSSCGEDHHRV